MGHQDTGALARLLRLRGRGRGQIVPQDNSYLGTGGAGPGQEAVAVRAVHNAAGPGPVHGLGRIGGDIRLVGEIRTGLRRGAARVPPQDGGDLLPGHRVVGSEQAAAVAADHALPGGPEDGIGVPGALRRVGKAVTAGDDGAARRPVQGLRQHGAGHGAVRIKGGGGGAAHQTVVPDVCHGIRIPGVRGHIGKAGVRRGREGGQVHAEYQGQSH